VTGPASGRTVFLREEAEARPRGEGIRVPLDTLVWVALVIAAAALRFARLDALPLTFDESARAFEALRVSQNSVPAGWDGDLTAAATSYLLRAFEETEFVVRLVPALAGALTVVAAWLSGRALGPRGALVAGALLAFSPLMVLMSRTAAPYSFGALLAVAMTGALFSYLERPRALPMFGFSVAFGLALSSDPVGVTAALAVVAFLFLEPMLSRESAVARGWAAFRASPAHWLSAAMVLAAALELGLTHFGTSLDRIGLAGFELWGEMFELPRDGREPEYHLFLLLAYDWPVLLAGGGAFAFYAWRLVRRGGAALSPPQLFVLVWLALAAVVAALVTQREAGQLLMLVVPLALLAGLAAEELLPSLDWSLLRRWWPMPALALALLAGAAVVFVEWANTSVNRAELSLLWVAVLAALGVLATAFLRLGRSGTVVALVVAAAVAGAFLAHTDLGLTRNDEAAEPAVDLRTAPEIDAFRDTVALLASSRAAPVVVDPALREPLAWELRDLPVEFGLPDGEVGAMVVPAGLEPDGFTPLGEEWRIGEGWYPEWLSWRPLWRWQLYREPYGRVDSVDVRILVPAP
jgi:4-amino-4-deoxy-L-arabinose transferase-like glycosyltransferase